MEEKATTLTRTFSVDYFIPPFPSENIVAILAISPLVVCAGIALCVFGYNSVLKIVSGLAVIAIGLFSFYSCFGLVSKEGDLETAYLSSVFERSEETHKISDIQEDYNGIRSCRKDMGMGSRVQETPIQFSDENGNRKDGRIVFIPRKDECDVMFYEKNESGSYAPMEA